MTTQRDFSLASTSETSSLGSFLQPGQTSIDESVSNGTEAWIEQRNLDTRNVGITLLVSLSLSTSIFLFISLSTSLSLSFSLYLSLSLSLTLSLSISLPPSFSLSLSLIHYSRLQSRSADGLGPVGRGRTTSLSDQYFHTSSPSVSTKPIGSERPDDHIVCPPSHFFCVLLL